MDIFAKSQFLQDMGQDMCFVMQSVNLDFDLYAELEEIEIEIEDYRDVYGQRKYDFCQASNDILAEYAGIHRSSIYSALESMEKNFLLEWNDEYRLWKVYLRGNGTYWKRSYLNEKIGKSYRHISQYRKSTGHAVEKLPENVAMVPSL